MCQKPSPKCASQCGKEANVLIGFIGQCPTCDYFCVEHRNDIFEQYLRTGHPGQIVILPLQTNEQREIAEKFKAACK